jgi:predicted nucleotidyltransferase component of viral defense system
MSKLPITPSETPYDTVEIDIPSWVEEAKANPTLHLDRQVTEIVLTAIGIAPTLSANLVLKGGAAMALAFKSDRVTGDVDFTALQEPEGFEEIIRDELNKILPKTALDLGYVDLLCRVQSIKKMPRSENFLDHDFPALKVNIGYAKRGTNQEQRLAEGKASRTVEIDISFRDQVYAFQELTLAGAGVAVRAFTVHEIIAEKLRALLQQPERNRARRQDVYDIAYLIELHEFDEKDRAQIHDTLIHKCKSHGVDATAASFENKEIRDRAERNWKTLAAEVQDLPPFEERFGLVYDLYISLPWEA